jgi:thioredoxin 1
MDTFTDASWDREVLASPVPVVIGFCAEWCIPSRMARPALESAEQHHAGRLRFGMVDGDENPGLMQRYAVQGLPTVMVVKDGEPMVRRVGLMGRAALLDVLARYV